MRFDNAKGVIRALVLSERVWQDMTLAMRHPETWKQNVVLRKWEPVDIDLVGPFIQSILKLID